LTNRHTRLFGPALSLVAYAVDRHRAKGHGTP
jgi:hypothetical protein